MNKDRISATIRALLAKTVENGCTEEEALAAAAKAAELLAKYNLTVDEVQLRANPFKKGTGTFEDHVGERLSMVAGAISKLTGARTWRSALGVSPIEITFFGFEHEVLVAEYLLAICERAMRAEAVRLNQRFGLLRPERRRLKTLPYLDGMRDRLSRRILAMCPPTPTGRGLVVVRNQLIDAELRKEGIKLNERDHRASRNSENSYREGLSAADRVSLNRGLGGATSAPRRISSEK